MKQIENNFKGIILENDFWDIYAEKVNYYHFAIQQNYLNNKISLKEKCEAHENVNEFFMDFFVESSKLVL